MYMSIEDNETHDFAPYQYYEQQIIRRIHHFYISQLFTDPQLYIDMIHRIRSANSDDIIHIHLNTPGGRLDTGIQIINAMQSSEAHVVCSLESEVHSLGTLIFLAADEFIVHDNCMMMFHNFSGFTGGKGHEQVAQLQATVKWFTDIAQRLYVPFICEEELAAIFRGEDLWLHSAEIRDRLENMVKIMEEKMTEESTEAEDAKKAPKKKIVSKKIVSKKKSQ